MGEEFRSQQDALTEIGRTVVEHAVDEAEKAGVQTVIALIGDRPTQALVAAADKHDALVIVVGIYGESPLRGAMLGSTSAQAAASVIATGAVRPSAPGRSLRLLREDRCMARNGPQFGLGSTFLGIDRCSLDELTVDMVIVGAPFDGGPRTGREPDSARWRSG